MKKILKNQLLGIQITRLEIQFLFAIALGAKVVEKHFVIDKKTKGPDVSCSMDHSEASDLLEATNNIFNALSGRSKFLKEEEVTRKFAFHSVVSKREIKKGEKLSFKNLTTKRPGTGDFPANKIYDLIGKTSKKTIKKDELIRKKRLNNYLQFNN